MRIVFLDMIRGIAVLWMLFFQILNMFSHDYNLYAQTWIQYFNWLPIFMITVGFSLNLAYRKYGHKTFYSRVLKRAIYFSCLGIFLTYWCNFSTGGLFFYGYEILFTIGILSGFVSLLFLMSDSPAYFYLMSTTFFLIGYGLADHSITGAFNPYWLIAFMILGVLLSTIVSNYLVANNPKNHIEKILSYFGRHALFFYFTHFFIYRRVLLSTQLYQTFNLDTAIILTCLAIGGLTLLQKTIPFTSTTLFTKRATLIKEKLHLRF